MAMPAHRLSPTSEMPSMARSLPRNTESSGTAAASTSITLFDFSSTRVERSRVASIKVTVKISICPTWAIVRRIICRLPAACAVTSRTSEGVSTATRAPSSAAERLASSMISWMRGPAKASTRSGPVSTGRSSVPLSTAE